MSVLVTGASGFVGSHVCKQLGGKVHVMGRRSPKTDYIAYHYADFENSQFDFPTENGVNTVVHCAALAHQIGSDIDSPDRYRKINTLGTINLAVKSAKAGVKRFIFLSSIKVNGEYTETESPFLATDLPHPQDPYAISKADAERELFNISKETGMEVVIIRPPLVYGPGVKANFLSLMKYISTGYPVPFGCIRNNKRSFVYINNLVDLIMSCINHPNAANQVFLASDGYDVSTHFLCESIMSALGNSNITIAVPLSCYNLLGKLLRKQGTIDRLIGSLHVNIDKTRDLLNWSPPFTFQEGIKETVNHFKQQS